MARVPAITNSSTPLFPLDQACTVASAGWTAAIATVTYLTLCHPMSRLSELLEHRFASYFIPAAVYLIGLIPAAFGTGFFSQQDLGGVCWYKPGTLQNSLMLFVPRTVALLVVIVLCQSSIAFATPPTPQR